MIFPSAVRYRWACSCPSSLLSGATPCQYPQSACHTPNQRMSLSALISAIIFPKPLGNFAGSGAKSQSSSPLVESQSVIHQHPPDRNFLFHKLAGLLTDFFFCDFSVKSIPAAPAERAEHFRHTPLFPCSNPHALCKPGKHLVNRVCQCVCLSKDIQRFVNLGLPIQTGQHFQADFLLCSCFQICLKGFSHHGNKTRKAIRVF